MDVQRETLRCNSENLAEISSHFARFDLTEDCNGMICSLPPSMHSESTDICSASDAGSLSRVLTAESALSSLDSIDARFERFWQLEDCNELRGSMAADLFSGSVESRMRCDAVGGCFKSLMQCDVEIQSVDAGFKRSDQVEICNALVMLVDEMLVACADAGFYRSRDAEPCSETLQFSWQLESELAARIATLDAEFHRFCPAESCNDMAEGCSGVATLGDLLDPAAVASVATLDAGFRRFIKVESCNQMAAFGDLPDPALDASLATLDSGFRRFLRVESCNELTTHAGSELARFLQSEQPLTVSSGAGFESGPRSTSSWASIL